MIKMQVIGNLGRDCTVNNVNGKNVINFTVAHTEKYRDSQGNMQDKTTWVDCAWWTDRANISQYLTKGKQVYAEGTPEVRSFTKNDGTSGVALSMRVREVQLLGGRGEGAPQQQPAGNSGWNNNSSNAPQPHNNTNAVNDDYANADDDLPF